MASRPSLPSARQSHLPRTHLPVAYIECIGHLSPSRARIVVKAMDLRLRFVSDSRPLRFLATTFGKFSLTCASVTKQYNLVPGSRGRVLSGWEGNRRPDVALAIRQRLQWLIHLRAHSLRQGDEHPAYTHRGARQALHFKPTSR